MKKPSSMMAWPVFVDVYGAEVQLKPKRFWSNPGGLDGFAVMWNYCVALDKTGCVTDDRDEEELVGSAIDVETALSW